MRATAEGIARRIGPYDIERYLGRNGYVSNHLGRDREGGAAVVMVPRVSGGGAERIRGELARDIEAARIATRYGLARVLAADLEGRIPWIATEYIEGPTLLEAVRRHGPLRGAELHKLALSTTAALSVLHWFGLVHGDLTPSNIILASDAPRVAGAGFARAFAAVRPDLARRAATPEYTAPERRAGAQPQPEEDVYAWAAVMAFAATGHEPPAPPAPATEGESNAGREPGAGREPHERADLRSDVSAPSDLSRLSDLAHLSEPSLVGPVLERLSELVPRCLAEDPSARLSSERLMVSVVAAGNRGRTWRPRARWCAAPSTVPGPRTEPRRPLTPFRFGGGFHGSPYTLAEAMHAAPKGAAALFGDAEERGRLLTWLESEVRDTSLDRAALAARSHRPADAAAMFVAHFRPDLAAGLS